MGQEQLKRLVPARDVQIDVLDSFISTGWFLKSLILHGVNSGKLFVLKNYFTINKLSNGSRVVYVDCSAFISTRNFFSKTLGAVYSQVMPLESKVENIYCDNANKFMIKLEEVVQKYMKDSFIYLVLENLNCLADFGNLFHLIVGLNKIQEVLSLVNRHFTFVYMLDTFNLLYNHGLSELTIQSLPTVFFQSYKQDEVFRILTDSLTSQYLVRTHCRFSEDAGELSKAQQKFWQDYVKLVMDSFYSFTGANISLLVECLTRIWPVFTRKIFIDKSHSYNDFLKLYKENQHLFRSEIMTKDLFVYGDNMENSYKPTTVSNNHMDLPLFSKLILCSAYLASFVSPKHDFVVFSKLKSISTRKLYMKRLQSSIKNKKLINSRLLNPNAFELERMLAILHTIYSNISGSENGLLNSKGPLLLDSSFFTPSASIRSYNDTNAILNLDFYTQFSNLVSLNLILKTLGYTTNPNSDLLNPKLKFKINFSHDFVAKISQDLDFNINEYLID